MKILTRRIDLAREERRKHPRVKTDNLVSYICKSNAGNRIKKGHGRAINISQGGILIEAGDSFEWKDVLSMTIDIEGEAVSVKGEAVYSNPTDSGMFRTGIQFLETNDKILSFVIKLLRTYLY